MSSENRSARLGDLEKVIQYLTSYYKRNVRNFSEVEKSFYLKRLETTVLSYYINACLAGANRKEGRRRCNRLNREIFSIDLRWKSSMTKKYWIYHSLSILGVSDCLLYTSCVAWLIILKKIRCFNSFYKKNIIVEIHKML